MSFATVNVSLLSSGNQVHQFLIDIFLYTVFKFYILFVLTCLVQSALGFAKVPKSPITRVLSLTTYYKTIIRSIVGPTCFALNNIHEVYYIKSELQ